MILRPSERSILATAVLIAIAGYLVLWLCVKPSVFARSRSDFGTFYRAGSMVLRGDGQQVYDLAAEAKYDDALGTGAVDTEGHSVSLPFVFAPFSLAVYAPLALLPYKQAEAVCYAGNVGILLTLPLFLRRRLALAPMLSVLALIFPLVFLPAILALLQGQPSLLPLLLFAMGYADLTSGYETRAGCWFALAAFKPQFVLPLLLALLVWRKTPALRSFLLTCCGLSLVSCAIVGWHATLGYPRALIRYADMGNRLSAEHPASMPNLRGVLYLLLHTHLPPSLLQGLTILISLLLLTTTALLLRRHRQVSPTSFSLLLLVTLLTSYHAYLHDDSLLLLPVLLLGSKLRQTDLRGISLLTVAAATTIFLVSLAPTSLTTTGWQMFLAIAALAGLVALQMCDGDGASSVKAATEVSPMIPV